MKIAQIITKGDSYYGAQAHFHDICRMLHQDSHEVLAITGSQGDLTERLEADGVTCQVIPSLVREISPLEDWRCLGDLRSMMRDFRPDLVATHSSKAGILGRLAAKKENIPCIFTAHGWAFEEGIPFLHRMIFRQIERYIGKSTDQIITVHKSGEKLGLKNNIIDSSRIKTIHNGVRDLAKSYPLRPADTFTLCMVAEFRPQKDHATLIQALATLADRDWQATLIGGGRLLDEMKALAKENHIEDRIQFTGAVKNVPEYLASSHAMALITNWEGLPISILEGISLSLPIVASDVSGVREQVIDGYNGFLVEKGNAESVANALKTLIDDQQSRRKFSENSRILYEEKFTVEAMYEKTKALYEEVLRRKKGE